MNKKFLSEIYIIIAAVLWGMIGISVSGLMGLGLSRMDIVFVRSLIAFATLALYLLIKDRAAFKVRFKHLWCFFGTGVISLMLFNLCYFSAMKYTSLAIAAVLLYTAPAFVVLISAFVFREKITSVKIISLVMMFMGCIFVTGVFDERAVFSAKGVLFGLGSGLGYAMYSIFGRFALNRGYSSASVSLYTFLFAALGSAFFADFGRVASCVISPLGAFFSLFIGVVCCTLPYIFYTKGLTQTENGRASTLAMTEPLVATVISVAFFGDSLTFGKITGIVIMFAAIGFMNFDKRKEQN